MGAPAEYGAGGEWPSLIESLILFLPSDSGAAHMGNSPAMVAPGVSVLAIVCLGEGELVSLSEGLRGPELLTSHSFLPRTTQVLSSDCATLSRKRV